MRLTTTCVLVLGWAFLVHICVGASSEKKPAKGGTPAAIEIKIDGAGDDANYLDPVTSTQVPVEVKVNDKVTWKNTTAKKHTATSAMRKSDGHTPLFNTGTINAGKSKELEFKNDIYQAAIKDLGLKDGDPVKIHYFCGVHPDHMGSSIILKP